MVKINPVFVRIVILLFAILASAGLVGSGSAPPATWFVPDGSTLTATQMADYFDTSQLYFNVKSEANSNGEIRGEINPAAETYQTDAGDPFAANPANNPVTFGALLGGDQVRPRNIETRASGYGSVTLDPLNKQLAGFIVTSGIAGTAAQLCDGLPGARGTTVLALEGGPVVWTIPANTLLSDAQIARLSAGAYYFNVPSDAFPDGELRGQLSQQVRFAALKGANEIPPVVTGAKGTGFLALDPVARKFSGFVKAEGLGSAVTSVVIARGDAATNSSGFLSLVDNGNGVWSVPAFNNPVLTDTVIAAFNNDTLFFNIRTQTNPGGEIRGQIVRASVKIGTAALDGAKEVPPVSTLATGTGMLAWNSVTEMVSGSVKTDSVSGTEADIHSGSVSTNGPVLIPLTVTSPVTVAPTPGISFGLDIQPIFNGSCARSAFCHTTGGATPMSLQSGVSYPNALFLLVPGNSASSYFYDRITGEVTPQMPLNRPPLSQADQDLFKNWIDKGALFDFYPVDVTITAAAAADGSITPSGAVTVIQGTNKTYAITPNAGYMVTALVVDGILLPGATSYTFTNVRADHYINAYFGPASNITLTSAAASSGTISPLGVNVVAGGTSQTFTITPNAGFMVTALVVDGVQLPGASTYTFANITADHYINAYFAPAPAAITISAAAGPNGSISPPGATSVTTGTDQTYTITPDAGFTVAALVVDGTLLPGATSYTFTNVTTDHYINAYFEPLPAVFTINAAAAPNGAISPAGANLVAGGANQTFTITPDAGFTVAALVVDGTQLPGATSYTFTNVTTDHYVNAYFAPVPATVSITAAAAPDGAITPAGATLVATGANQTYTITPDAGFTVAALVVDGILLPGATSYTFTNVTTDHYINAYFGP